MACTSQQYEGILQVSLDFLKCNFSGNNIFGGSSWLIIYIINLAAAISFRPDVLPPHPTAITRFLPRVRVGRETTPYSAHVTCLLMKEDPENKARRRRSTRESFPTPLNQIALRHVDTVQSLDSNRREILAKALTRAGMAHVTTCLAIIKGSRDSIQTESDLLAALHLTEIPICPSSQDNKPDVSNNVHGGEEIDTDYLASLLVTCYPDMPQTTADALVGSEVMALSLRVVSATRLALADAKSDFIITALYTLFEEKLDEIEQIVADNPAFTKAMQLSRPDWKSN